MKRRTVEGQVVKGSGGSIGNLCESHEAQTNAVSK